MKYHPDDQAEIDRLHAEFIAVDEPNNEQVMAFQDASYALGLKRGQACEAALQQRLNEADLRIDDAAALLRRAQQMIPNLQYNWHANTAILLSQTTKDSPEVGSRAITSRPT